MAPPTSLNNDHSRTQNSQAAPLSLHNFFASCFQRVLPFLRSTAPNTIMLRRQLNVALRGSSQAGRLSLVTGMRTFGMAESRVVVWVLAEMSINDCGS